MIEITFNTIKAAIFVLALTNLICYELINIFSVIISKIVVQTCVLKKKTN